MKNMEREKFEDSWRDAFDGAEISPSDKVWTNIELELEKEKGGALKKRLLFYQMLAAASVVFAMSIGGVGLYYSYDQEPIATNAAAETDSPIAPADRRTSVASPEDEPESRQPLTTPTDNAIAGNNDPLGSRKENTDFPGDNEQITRSDGGISPDRNSVPTKTVDPSSEQATFAALAEHEKGLPDLPHSLDDKDLQAFYTPKAVDLNIPAQEEEAVDPVVAMLARLEQREKEVQGDERDKRDKGAEGENLWTSVGFAAGSFNTMQSTPSSSFASGANTTMALAAPIVDQEAKATGYSYSMGVNLGTKISERWVLQGGVNYLTHASEYTSNNVVVSGTSYQTQRFRAASTNELIKADAGDLSNKIVYSAPYNVNNSMRYLSIPLQAGYLLVNKTFGVQLNAGVATDLFLQNTVTADSDQLDKTSQPGGSDSPYRSVNLSGLFGTEVSYRFGQHYRIALNPGIRYPFNTIYKSELGVQSTPLTFDVGLRFRYIFH